MPKLIGGLVLALLMLPGLAAAEFDVAGNYVDGGPGQSTDNPGDPCGTCPDPAGGVAGVAYKGGDLHLIASGQIWQLQNCQAVGSTVIQGIGNPYGLGYDSMRDLWIITDPGPGIVYQVNMAGQVVNSWPAPSPRPVGAAYDPGRDLYWLSDWSINRLNSIDPNTGTPGMSWQSPVGTRIAGTGYDAGGDVLFYNGRDQAMSFVISAATGQQVVSFPVPFGGNNNGQGTAVAPDGNGWLTHREQPTIFCVELLRTTPVEQSTWGSIKAIYE
jgi:hypothetical protein